MRAQLQARGTAISAGTWVKCKKEKKIPTNKERGEIQGIGGLCKNL